MADRLSRIIGTEEDKVNCAFYFKIGACRHGDRCSRNHLRPSYSQTLLIPHMYLAPAPGADGQPVDDADYFEDFYEEVVEEFATFGGIEELNVVENLGDHMFGNVYVKFIEEDSAHKCLQALTGRYYAGRVLMPEYSPVTDFREARCRQHEETHCGRGGYCNFMHLKKVPRAMRKLLRKSRKKKDKSRSRSRGRRSRSGSRGRKRMSSRSREREEFKRASSAERRAIFRQWNREREKEKKAEAAAAAKAQAAGAPAVPDINPALVAQTLAAATGTMA